MSIRRRLLISALALLVLGAAGTWWFLLRDTSEEKLALTDDPVAATSDVTTADATADLGGTWTIVAATGAEATTAGYRVQEQLAGGLTSTTATARTAAVTGTVTVAGTEVTAAEISVDMTSLVSDKDLRDSVMKTMGLQTDTYPTATFRLTEPIALPDLVMGKVVSVGGTGELTLHGTTQTVTVALDL